MTSCVLPMYALYLPPKRCKGVGVEEGRMKSKERNQHPTTPKTLVAIQVIRNLNPPVFSCAIFCWATKFHFQTILYGVITWKHLPLLPLCEGKPPVTSGFLHKGRVMLIFDVFFVVSMGKLLNKQWTWLWCTNGNAASQQGMKQPTPVEFKFIDYSCIHQVKNAP